MALIPAFMVASCLLVLAGAGKILAPDSTESALRALGLGIPRGATRLLGGLEMVVGVAAVVRPGLLTGALVALAYAGFCVFLALSRRVGPASDCGCFGSRSGVSTQPGALHLVMNLAGCLVAMAVAVLSPPGLGWMLTRPPLVAAPLIAGTAAATFAAYLTYTVVPAAWRAYGAGRSG